ncbi:MAG: GNAT family N-acetyltransferase [Lachnospiraceae bacterium]|nr:GNAT family N-acetyltransferase [Lachnospiraceae bacterium]
MFSDETGKIYDIGYCIHKKFWRQGYGSETLSLMLDWMKAQGAGKVTAEVAVGNVPSNRLLVRLGFVVEKKAKFQ